MRIYRCDRCGEIFERNGMTVNTGLFLPPGDPEAAHAIDLCPDCVAEYRVVFLTWYRNGRPAPALPRLNVIINYNPVEAQE